MEQFPFVRDIAASATWSLIKPIDKGWSRDKKYYIESNSGERYLLRLADAKYSEAKQREYQVMAGVAKLGLNMSQPLDLGVCGEGQYVYTLLTWVEGLPLDEVVTTFSNEAQYKLGAKAGVILRTLHSIPAPPEQECWEQRMCRKIALHLEKYRACGIQVAGEEHAMQYIEQNLSLLAHRPQVFQHGDYHVGNLILTSDGSLGVIDFNRWDYGDPWEEFYKMMLFSRELSIPFAKGQLHGYFGGEAPDLFYRLLALYLADVILFSVVWAIPFGSDEVEGMVKRALMVMDDYATFRTHRPSWAR